MPKKKRWEKVKEPFIACIDDVEGGFELVEWHETEEEAIKAYNSFEGKYPDEEGRHKHLFKMIQTSGHDLDQTSGEYICKDCRTKGDKALFCELSDREETK